MSQLVPQDKFAPSEVSFGAGALSGSYDDFTQNDAVEAYMFRLGINCFDTSPYYGRSEYVLGDALQTISKEFPRQHYYISTKTGRFGYTTKDFDFSAKKTYESVEKSMNRLHTDYLDVVYCHDVEFVPMENIVGPGGALEALFNLKAQGKVKYVGISGYPLDVLLKIAQYQFEQKNQPLDIILSYCHYTLQNTKLADYAPKLRKAGVKYIMNASPLCMALLREGKTPDWHPAHKELREAADKAAVVTREQYGLAISDLASRFSFQGKDEIGINSTLIGLARKSEVQDALRCWRDGKERKENSEKENQAYALIFKLLEPYKNYSWQSPTTKELAQ
ncbi:NADP-dependent oxidoreductase domain-containing protein [Mycotypha africana]|uniref:NADP-dependent oxidoreductase domain-containing protein n=1 Tax=Mycotypha africana TaxID=64632 RepID=UPI002301434A|nr:NADP-dependent oxidoreductase domain-containing protein [Mycotypha africana]KAI8977249.1 NADP-dependent oxidoreductase domain-containing protein [Mycotypha africana]